MNEKIYLHTINNGMSDFYKSRKQLDTLDSILKSGKVLSRRLQGYPENSYTNFSGMDYISLTDYEKRFVCNKEKEFYNSFYAYVRRGLSLAFPQESIKVIEPTILPILSKNIRDFEYMRLYGLDKTERFTDLPDEVQVKDKLTLKDLNGVLFPCDNYMHSKLFTRKEKMIKLLLEEVKIVKEILEKYNKEVNIYDVDSLLEVNEDNIENIVLKK